jgi:protein O-mannosyl-transferase
LSSAHRKKKTPARTPRTTERTIHQPIQPPALTLRTLAPLNRLDWIFLAGIAALTAAVFCQVIQFGFISIDNSLYGTANPHLAQGLTRASLEWAFRETINYWQPLTYLSHLIDFQLFGTQLARHHAVSLFWHLLDTLLLYSLMRYLTGAQWKSAAVAAIFAIHPLHAEPVAWLASRKDVLSTFFLLATIGAYCFWLRKPSPYRYSLMAVIFALGLMTKPSVTILPVLLLALDYWPLGRWTRGRGVSLVMEKLPLFLLSAIIIALSLRSYETTTTIVQAAGARSAVNALPAARSLISPFHYLKQVFWPAGLSVHYPVVRPTLARALPGFFGLVAISYLCVRYARRFPYLPSGWFWFLAGLAPTLGMGLGDRFAYVPSIGLFWIFAWALEDACSPLPHGGRIAAVAGSVGIAALAVCTFFHLPVWRDNASLLTHAVASYPNDMKSRFWLAGLLAATNEPEKAMAEYREVLRHDPDNFETILDLAHYHLRTGHLPEAVDYFQHALRIQPNRVDILKDLADLLFTHDHRADAIPYYQRIHRLNPQNTEVTDILEAYHAL